MELIGGHARFHFRLIAKGWNAVSRIGRWFVPCSKPRILSHFRSSNENWLNKEQYLDLDVKNLRTH